ncbi:BEL1-like homeodomain protein 7 [Platanthera guangdongensis]|uniref:BEL1-like homeodomain protein 7 n=1 Tax=Platanthera guangdongensis TaxID=2320717 RepID=A0ABR2MNX0_9ASPA
MEMFEEVDRRYMQYHHQMQIVKSSFDVIAGPGAAKPYTALALQTISRHFRCLRDAISAQIQLNRKKLGASQNGDGVRLCRLRYIDQQLRQQRAAQQFGMMQPHAWRPQRGLPENSVSILRAWLFEHFLHPYPKDSEKLMLARRTGLTRNQVANWFINARVRLWKPMIEEMHREEVLDADRDSNSSPNKLQKVEDQTIYSTDREEDPHISDAENSKPSNSSEHSKTNPTIEPETLDHNPTTDHSNLYDGSGRFMAYQMPGLGQYGADMVSLTLGLHHWNSALPVEDGHQSFLPVRKSDLYAPNSSPLEANAAVYELVSMGDRHHGCESLHFMQGFVP